MAAPLPSPWDPLLISPSGGGGNGSRERGHVVVVEGVAVKGVLVVWVEMACFAFLWVPASAGMTWACGNDVAGVLR